MDWIRRHIAKLTIISAAELITVGVGIVAREFPGWGTQVQALVIAMIAVHEIVGPIGFQFALHRAGEVGAADPCNAVKGAASVPSQLSRLPP